MLILKLIKGNSIRIIEAREVAIYPVGEPQEDSDQTTNSVIEVVAETGEKRGDSGSAFTQVFYVKDKNTGLPRRFDGLALQDYEAAYVENSQGKTTQIIRAY